MVVNPTKNFLFGPSSTTRAPIYYDSYVENSDTTCSDKLLKSKSITVECMRHDSRIPCSNNHYPGETVTLKCKVGYTAKNYHSWKKELKCLPSGEWSSANLQCVPICGKVTKKATALVVYGSNAEAADFPWNVAIYKSIILICGGTIISGKFLFEKSSIVSFTIYVSQNAWFCQLVHSRFLFQ